MNDYPFELHFDELSEELQEEKIDKYIMRNYDNREYLNEKGENSKELSETLLDIRIREDARRRIVAHFPIYF